MPFLIPELEELRRFVKTPLEERTLDRVLWLAGRCERLTYLVFIGD